MTRIPRLHAASGWAVAALLSAAAGLISPPNAQTIGSSYTSTAPRDCRMIGKPSELDRSTTRLCPGKASLVVLIAEDDLRETVSVGRNRVQVAREPAAGVWFGPFNSTGHTVDAWANPHANELARKAIAVGQAKR
jgi:hypothetical protein